jgi:hypothetical protein
MFIGLPTRFHHAGDFALAGQFAETNAAKLESPNVRASTTAVLATVVFSRRELSGPALLYFPCQFRHKLIFL